MPYFGEAGGDYECYEGGVGMIGFINGSPKSGISNSRMIIGMMKDMIKSERITFSTAKYEESMWGQLGGCDRIILVFPLYVDSLPSHLLSFLMEWEQRLLAGEVPSVPVYAVAQCGFYEGIQNRYALNIVENFCLRTGLIWGGGIGLGGTGALAGGLEQFSKPLKKLLTELSGCVELLKNYTGSPYACIGMPGWMYKTGGNMGWITQAKKYGLSKKDLWAKNNGKTS